MEIVINSERWATGRDDFIKSLESMGYSAKSLRNYRGVINKLEKFSKEKALTIYTHEIGQIFIESMAGKISEFTLMLHKTVLRRLDEFFVGSYHFQPRMAKTQFIVPDRFQNYLNDYLEYMKLQGKRESTVKNHSYYCAGALSTFDILGIGNISNIEPQDIYDAFAMSSSKSNWSNTCKCFFRYLYKIGGARNDMSVYVPSVRRSLPLPSTYSREETYRLLESIDRSTDVGKRNYAIVLLALRLGIRVGDIVTLKLENVNFRTKTIEFVQKKTQKSQRLEMLPEIEKALTAYLPCRKPKNDCDNLFLSVRPPYGQITRETVNRTVGKLFKAANICTEGKKHGTHSLRMTLASELVSENVPYAVVGKILGHENPNSAGSYVKFDLEMLRACSLEIPPPSGLLARMLALFDGGRV